MSIKDEYNMIFKVILIGDSGVGKSNILTRYLNNEFNHNTKTTVGVEFGSKKNKIENYSIKTQIWDTAGQERYKSITNAYYKGSKGAVVVYDITNKKSFENVDKWISDLKTHSSKDVSVIIVGNKLDLEAKRQVTMDDGQNKAKIHNAAFMETSALTCENIDNAFDILINEIFNKMKLILQQEEKNGYKLDSNGMNLLRDKEEKEVKKSCC
jgi:small GTP-binding protein